MIRGESSEDIMGVTETVAGKEASEGSVAWGYHGHPWEESWCAGADGDIRVSRKHQCWGLEWSTRWWRGDGDRGIREQCTMGRSA